MLVLDFINVGNGDSTLIREFEGGRQICALMVDCGHYALMRDDHPPLADDRSRRIFAGDFLRKAGVDHLDLLLLTHFHRDHIGGLSRVLEAVDVGELAASYLPPEGAPPLDPDGDNGLPKAGRNVLRCMDLYARSLREHPGRIARMTELPGDRQEVFHLTEQLTMEVDFGEPSLYARQKVLCDAMFAGVRDRYDLMHWSKAMNATSLRQRLYYRGREIVLGGDAFAVTWDNDTLTPCDILKVPHHGSLTSVNRKFLRQLQPQTAVVSVASERPDERPHPYIVSLLQECVERVVFTDAVSIPGLVEPVHHESVHMEIGDDGAIRCEI